MPMACKCFISLNAEHIHLYKLISLKNTKTKPLNLAINTSKHQTILQHHYIQNYGFLLALKYKDKTPQLGN